MCRTEHSHICFNANIHTLVVLWYVRNIHQNSINCTDRKAIHKVIALPRYSLVMIPPVGGCGRITPTVSPACRKRRLIGAPGALTWSVGWRPRGPKLSPGIASTYLCQAPHFRLSYPTSLGQLLFFSTPTGLGLRNLGSLSFSRPSWPLSFFGRYLHFSKCRTLSIFFLSD